MTDPCVSFVSRAFFPCVQVLIISHDQYFLQGCVSEFWSIADRKLNKVYDAMESEAKRDKKDFCAKMTPVAKDALKDLPPTL